MFSVKITLFITVTLLISKTRMKSIEEVRDEVNDLLRYIKTVKTREVVHHIEERLSEEISIELQDMTRDELVKPAELLVVIQSPNKEEVTSHLKYVNSLSDEKLREHLYTILSRELDTKLKALDNDKLNYLDDQLTADNGERHLKLSPAALEDVAAVIMGERGNDADLLSKLTPDSKDGESQQRQKRFFGALFISVASSVAGSLAEKTFDKVAQKSSWK